MEFVFNTALCLHRLLLLVYEEWSWCVLQVLFVKAAGLEMLKLLDFSGGNSLVQGNFGRRSAGESIKHSAEKAGSPMTTA